MCMGSSLGDDLNCRYYNDVGGGGTMINRCSLCNDNEESIYHILIHYEKTRVLWSFILVVFMLKWVFLASMRNLLSEWKLKGQDKKRRIAWCMAPPFACFGVY